MMSFCNESKTISPRNNGLAQCRRRSLSVGSDPLPAEELRREKISTKINSDFTAAHAYTPNRRFIKESKEKSIMDELRILLQKKKTFFEARQLIDSLIQGELNGKLTSRIFSMAMRFVTADDHPELHLNHVLSYFNQISAKTMHTRGAFIRTLGCMKQWTAALYFAQYFHKKKWTGQDTKYKEALYQGILEGFAVPECPKDVLKEALKIIEESNLLLQHPRVSNATIQTKEVLRFLDCHTFSRHRFPENNVRY